MHTIAKVPVGAVAKSGFRVRVIYQTWSTRLPNDCTVQEKTAESSGVNESLEYLSCGSFVLLICQGDPEMPLAQDSVAGLVTLTALNGMTLRASMASHKEGTIVWYMKVEPASLGRDASRE